MTRHTHANFGRIVPLVLGLTLGSLLPIAANAQSCSVNVPSDWVTIYASNRMQSGSTIDQLRNWMRSHSKAQLDTVLPAAAPCDEDQYVRWNFHARGSNDYISVAKFGTYCASIRNFLVCNQRSGWPYAKPEEEQLQAQQSATPRKGEVSGADILLSDLNQQRAKGPNDAALDRIDQEEEKLGCYQKGADDPACHDLELRRSNLLNNKPEMSGLGPTPGQTTANPTNTSSKKSTAEPNQSRTTSIDVDSGLSASQCVYLVGKDEAYSMSGDKNECLIVKDGKCYYKTVTLAFQNKCKRAVQAQLDWGGKTGFISLPSLGSGQSSCQVMSGKNPGYPRVDCSPGSLIDPHF